MLWQLALLVVGLVLVTVGAEWLVRGAARGAAKLGVTPLVVGLTVVAFGTSAPEIALGLFAIGDAKADLALGNVVGSNIFNLLFVVGAAALARPLLVPAKLVRFELPLLLATSLLVVLMTLDGRVGRLEGAVLFAGLVAYLAYTVHGARKAAEGRPVTATAQQRPSTQREERSPAKLEARSLWLDAALLVVGLALLGVGARLLVSGAAGMARSAGVSELLIGLTVLAAGTSVPEVATSLVAARRGERDIAVGNAIGSSLFNLLGVLGLTALAADGGVSVAPAALLFDLPAMIVATAISLPIFVTRLRIDRWEGGMLLGYYGVYLSYLLLDATGHRATDALGWTMLVLVPLSAIALVVLAFRAVRGGDDVSAALRRTTLSREVAR